VLQRLIFGLTILKELLRTDKNAMHFHPIEITASVMEAVVSFMINVCNGVKPFGR
jgi:hypothetical protein